MTISYRTGLALLLAVSSGRALSGQTAVSSGAPRFDLSIDNIMRGPELYGTAPTQVRFSDDARWVYFRWRKPGVDTADTSYRVRVEGGEPEALTREQADSLTPQPGTWSTDRRLKVYVSRGDVWLYEAGRGARRLTETPAFEGSAQLSGDGRTVFFVRDNNLFSLALGGDGLLRQLTDVRRGNAPRPPRDSSAQRSALQRDQRDLFEFVRRPPPEVAAEMRAGPPQDSARMRPIWLPETQNIARWEVSPDGRRALITVSERAAGSRVQTMPVWVTLSGYIENRDNRTKVGDEQATRRAALVTLETGALQWIDVGVPARTADIDGVSWNRSGTRALVRWTTKNYEQRGFAVVDTMNQARVLDVLRDSAWVGQLSGVAGWLPDGETVFFSSERSGWSHLYAIRVGDETPRALTAADRPFEVRQVSLSPDGRRFYFHSNETHFGEQHFYAMNVTGGAATQLTRGDGREDVEVSPDERWLAVVRSTANMPPELFIQPNRDGVARQVTVSTSEEFRRYAWRPAELVMIPARDGAQVPARIYRPARANGAAVIFVHGAGYLQNAHKWWSSYSREYLFHHFLADRGYTVLDMDYRASAGLGRDWRTGIYRHMGGKDLTDNVDGARWLVQQQGIDSTRIGIYGGSYGGFITLMAMFTTPGVFRAGAALRPVTDWAHYNHGSTAAILNEPQEDTLAYRQSSPIYFAEGLRGNLLIAHGMVDDNVNFQDAVRLVQRLIELRKENWELAVYPVEPHGFRMASSWADEYKRIFRLFETSLRPTTAASN